MRRETILSVTFLFCIIIAITGCSSGILGNIDDLRQKAKDKNTPPVVTPADTDPVTIAIIPGVTPPAYSETPVSVIVGTTQYTGTVTWDPVVSGTFAASTTYTAYITLTPKAGFTLQGVEADFFTVAGADTVSNTANDGFVTAVFPATGSSAPTIINIAAIPGITPPALGETPVFITETAQYSGNVTWSPNVNNPGDIFKASVVYTASITLTAKPNFTLQGVGTNFFTVAGAATVSNPASSASVTAVFPKTIAVITITQQPAGTTRVPVGEITGSLNVAASVTEDIAFTYQWYENATDSNSGGTAIPGKTDAVFAISHGTCCGNILLLL